MPVELNDYVPTLCLRPAEMRGLEFLPAISKNRIVPCFLFSPWTSARSLERGMDRIEECFPNRQFLLDLDRDYDGGNWERPAQRQFRDLLHPEDGYAQWWEHWIGYPNAIPCLQLVGATTDSVSSQIDNLQAAEREFCLRLRVDRLPPNLDEIIDVLVDRGIANYSVLLEAGWTDDPLTLSAQYTGLINNALAALDGRIPVIVSCTSAPRSYSAYQEVSEIPFSNRQLLNNVRRNAQRETVVYGDWGSTKPRENGFGRTPLPRVDFPTNESWIIARNKEEEWDFSDAAQAIIESDHWTGDLGIWGEELIEETVVDQDSGINSAQKNVSARVNIHLHRQAMFGDNIQGLDLEEDWED